MFIDIVYIKKFVGILLNTSHSMSISLIPYLLIFIYNILNYKLCFYYFIPLIVFINGVIYHSFFQDNKYIVLYDTFTNILILIYTIYLGYYNLDNYDKIIHFIVILYVSIMFLASYKFKSYFIHIVCVQLLLLELYIEQTKYYLIP